MRTLLVWLERIKEIYFLFLFIFKAYLILILFKMTVDVQFWPSTTVSSEYDKTTEK